MSRNRVIYQSEALFVSTGVSAVNKADHAQLRRVQSANYSFNVSRTDINQFGQLSRIDSLILEAPTVSADISYFLTDGFNEEALGFSNSDLNVGFVSGQIESTSGRNLYIVTAQEGKDANNIGSTGGLFGTIGIGNAFITDYSLEASVGSFPTVSISFEGSNMNASANVTGHSTGISGGFGAFTGVGITGGLLSGAGIDPVDGTPDPTQITASGIGLRPTQPVTETGVITALRPGDVTLSLTNANEDTIAVLTGSDAVNVQSVSLSVPLSRTPIEKLGTRFPFARVVDFPVTPTLSVSAIVNETQVRALTNIIETDNFISSADITIKQPGSTDVAAIYRLTNLKLDSESFSSSIGPNKTVDLAFSVSIGGPDDTTNNVFFSGANTDVEFSLNPITISGNSLNANESVTINGVTITGSQQKIIGYNHGQLQQTFDCTYTSGSFVDDSIDLQFSNTGTTLFSGENLESVSGITGFANSGTSTPRLVIKPLNLLPGTSGFTGAVTIAST